MMQCLLQPPNAASCARGHGEADEDAFALMRVANAHSVYATPRYQTWRRSSFGRLSVGEPRSSHTRCTNAPRAMCATSASDVAPSATIFAEPWDSEVFARTASSQSCSAIFWTWRCSSFHFAHPTPATAHRGAWRHTIVRRRSRRRCKRPRQLFRYPACDKPPPRSPASRQRRWSHPN